MPSLGAAIGLPFSVSPSGGAGPEPVERINNGGFTSDVGWNTSGAAWVIDSGSATNAIVGMFLSTTLNDPVISGDTYFLNISVLLNPAGTAILVQLFNSTTSVFQTIFNETIAGGGSIDVSGAVTGTFDTLRIRALDDPGLIIDDVSLLA